MTVGMCVPTLCSGCTLAAPTLENNVLAKTLLTGIAGLALTAAGAVPASAMLETGTGSRSTAPASSSTSSNEICDYPAKVVTATTLKIYRASADYGEDIGARVRVSTVGAEEEIDGDVVVTINGAALAAAEVTDGGAFVELPARLGVGPAHEVVAAFQPDDCSVLLASSSQLMTFTVVTTPANVNAAVQTRQGKRFVHIRTSTRSGISPTGKVDVKVTGPRTDKHVKGSLAKGRAEVGLGKFTRPGTYTVTVDYDGARGIRGDKTRTTFKVKR